MWLCLLVAALAYPYQKLHHFRSASRLEVLHRGLLKLAARSGWELEAWAVFSNHYHFVARSPEHEPTAQGLVAMLSELHKKTSEWVNRLDAAPGRQVWFNYWDTRLTFQRSYLARLNYVHQNPARVGCGSQPVSLVLGAMVRAHGLGGPG